MTGRRVLLGAALTLALGALGCSAAEGDPNAVGPQRNRAPAQAAGLAGTSWTLLGYDSFEDGVARATPAAGETYRLTFEPDGRLSLRFACHRGSGRWQATRSEPDRGSLDFSAVEIARTPCPGARMTGLARDLEFVASYVLGPDGRLTLNLQADSGNLVWERARR